MARKKVQPLMVDAVKAQQDRKFLETMAALGADPKTRASAKLILELIGGDDLESARAKATYQRGQKGQIIAQPFTKDTAKKKGSSGFSVGGNRSTKGHIGGPKPCGSPSSIAIS